MNEWFCHHRMSATFGKMDEWFRHHRMSATFGKMDDATTTNWGLTIIIHLVLHLLIVKETKLVLLIPENIIRPTACTQGHYGRHARNHRWIKKGNKSHRKCSSFKLEREVNFIFWKYRSIWRIFVRKPSCEKKIGGDNEYCRALLLFLTIWKYSWWKNIILILY